MRDDPHPEPRRGDQAQADDAPSLSQVTQRFERLGLRSSPGWVVALSGGLDSTCLAHMALRLGESWGRHVVLAHVDHQLRDSSSLDAARCARQAHAWGAPLRLCVVRVASVAGSVQRGARQARYAALAQVAREHGLAHVLTAHHEDDLLEGALLRLQRGAGARGLVMASSSPLPGDPDLRLVRPLLWCSRAALRSYALRHALSWSEDPTNAQDDYTRNALRHHVMPTLLEAPGARAGMRRALEHVSQEAQALQGLVDELAARALRPGHHLAQRRLDAAALAQAPQAIAVGVLQQAARALQLEDGLGPEDYAALLALCSPAASARTRVLRRASATRDARGELCLERLSASGQPEVHLGLKAQAHPLRLELSSLAPGGLLRPPWFEHALTLRWHEPDAPRSPRELLLQTPCEVLQLRGPEPGERIQVSQDRALLVKELLRQRGVPPEARWRWPCLADEQGRLLALGGGPLAAWARPDAAADGAARLLRLEHMLRS